MNELQYTLNGDPISARGLIREAGAVNFGFESSGFKSTSQAAAILRNSGFKVEENSEYTLNV